MKTNPEFIKWLKSRPNCLANVMDTTYIPTYEDFVEYCKEENYDMDEDELDIPEDDSDEYWEWAMAEKEFCQECDRDNLKWAKIAGRKCEDMEFLITGSLGLWWGHPEIQGEVMWGLDAVIDRCFTGCEDAVINYDTKAIYIDAYHHDGCNSFTIYPIKWGADTDKLQERMEKDSFNPDKGYDRRFFETIGDFLY